MGNIALCDKIVNCMFILNRHVNAIELAIYVALHTTYSYNEIRREIPLMIQAGFLVVDRDFDLFIPVGESSLPSRT